MQGLTVITFKTQTLLCTVYLNNERNINFLVCKINHLVGGRQAGQFLVLKGYG